MSFINIDKPNVIKAPQIIRGVRMIQKTFHEIVKYSGQNILAVMNPNAANISKCII